MKLTSKTCQMIVIDDVMKDHRLDPIRVITENLEPGKGRIIIVCFNAAWVGYWGAMGGQTVEQFVLSCDAEYLAGNIGCAVSLQKSESNAAYLVKIITAVQAALHQKPEVSLCASCNAELPAGCRGVFKDGCGDCALNEATS
jgi:hypothetical protein